MNADAVLNADEARRRAMIEADTVALDAILADDLTWTHSSGKTESKAQFMAAIASGTVGYDALTVTEDEIRGGDDVWVHNGTLTGAATRDGQAKALQARFLAVWRRHGANVELIAWQSTNFST